MTRVIGFAARIRVVATVLAGVASLMATTAFGEVVPPGTAEEIRARLQPFGELCRAGEDCGGTGVAAVAEVSGGGLSGEQVYSQFCFACHATGVSESPLLGDSDAWAPRIAKGMDVVWENTSNGLGLMPPRGTCMNCSDDELQSAIDYITGQ